MNILIITLTYPPSANGVAISTKRTVTTLRSMGHRVIVVGPTLHQKESDYIPLPTIRISFFGLADYPVPLPQPLQSLLRKLPKLHWDIIHVHHPLVVGPFAIRLGKHLQIPVVFTYHTQYDRYLEHLTVFPKRINRLVYEQVILSVCRRFDAIIATTKWLRKELVSTFGVSRVHYASTAGLTAPFFVHSSKSILRSRLHIPVDGPIFLSVSRLSREKRTEILLRGFLRWRELHQSGTLVIIGDGGHRRTLENIASVHAQGECVQFKGKIANEHLPSWYSAADLFLYSAITDTVGINMLEAMSAGLPVVAPDHETTREIIKPLYNGVLGGVEPDSMREAIDKALKKRKKLSHGAIITSKKYTIEKTTLQLLAIYEKVIKKFSKET